MMISSTFNRFIAVRADGGERLGFFYIFEFERDGDCVRILIEMEFVYGMENSMCHKVYGQLCEA